MYVRRKCFSRDIYGNLCSVKMFSGEEAAKTTTNEGKKGLLKKAGEFLSNHYGKGLAKRWKEADGFTKKAGVVAVPAATAAALAGAGYLGYRTYKKRKNRKNEED